MTMLDSMRRHIGWLKWSLGLVILAFAFLYVPSFGQPQPTGALSDVVARVGDTEITVAEFRTVYLRQLQGYQAQSDGEITAEILRSMGIDRQILQQMIDEHAALQEAERLGVTVSDTEVRDRIVFHLAETLDDVIDVALADGEKARTSGAKKAASGNGTAKAPPRKKAAAKKAAAKKKSDQGEKPARK